jgi:hypothetical protein
MGPGHDDVTRLGASGSLSCALGALACLDQDAKLRADDAITLLSMSISAVSITPAGEAPLGQCLKRPKLMFMAFVIVRAGGMRLMRLQPLRRRGGADGIYKTGVSVSFVA